MTWMTPTNEVAPYITGAEPRRISMRSTLARSRLGRAGLKAPPQGTPSTTRRKASNSRRPQISGTELAGPFSPPGATATPAARARAAGRSMSPRAAISSPEITVTEAGTVSTSWGVRVAVTWMVSATVGTAVCGGFAWAKAGRAMAKAAGPASARTSFEQRIRKTSSEKQTGTNLWRAAPRRGGAGSGSRRRNAARGLFVLSPGQQEDVGRREAGAGAGRGGGAP